MFKSHAASTSKKDGYKFDYRLIVFSLLNQIRLDDHALVKALFRRRNVYIAEHPVEDESSCEYNSLHYYAIIQLLKHTRFDNDRLILDIKKHCAFFKSEKAIAPINFLAYMQIPPRHIIFKNTLSESLLDFLLSEVTTELIESIKQNKY